MAMASAASLDSVVINVESNANNAGDGLAKLTKQLQTLRESVKGGFNNLTKLAKSLNDLKPASEGLATVASNLKELQSVTSNLKELSSIETPSGLTNTITRLKELSEVSNTLEKTANNVTNITKMVEPLTSLASIQKPLGLGNTVRYLTDLSKLGNLSNIISEVSKLPQIVEPLQSLGNISATRGMGTVIDNLKKLPDVMSKLGDTATLENIGRVARELVTHLEPLSQEMQRIANGYSAISKMSDTYGVSARTVTRYTKQSVSLFKQLGSALSATVGWFKKIKTGSDNFGNSAVKQFQKVNSKLKQVALSLIGTRTLFTMIRKAVSEYSAMDEELQKFSQNVWRAFGAQLAPAIEYAMYLFKQFVRVIYSVVLALTGVDLISRANQKAMAGWGKSAKDTLGNLQKFDDLNVVEFPKNSGSGDESSLIDLQTIDLTPFQKIIDWVKQMRDTIKEALDTGQWYNVGKVFAEGINGALSFLLSNMGKVRKAFFDVATKFGDFLNGALDSISWESVGAGLRAVVTLGIDTFTKLFKRIKWKQIGSGFTAFMSGLNLSELVSSGLENLVALERGIQLAINNVDWGSVTRNLSNAFVTALSGLETLILNIDSGELGRNLREILLSISWGEIFTEITNIFIATFSELGNFLEGLTGIDAISNLMLTIQQTSVNIQWDNLSKSLQDLYKAVKPFTTKVSEGLSWFYQNVLVPLSEYAINELVPKFIDMLSAAIDSFSTIIDVAKPFVKFMWDEFLNPLLKITQMAIIKLIEDLTKKFKGFSDWCRDNHNTVELMVDLIGSFLGTLVLYLSIKNVPMLIGTLATALKGFAGALSLVNIPLVITVAGLASLVWAIVEISKHWDIMNNMERVISVLGALAIAATTAAIAVGALQSAWSLGVAAVAIAAGIAAITLSISSAKKRAEQEMANSKIASGGGFRGYAEGGFPEKGQYFYARENGIPELVGSIGSQAAVANNTQIVDAVSSGVEQAMLRAMQADDNTTPINVYIGTEKIYSAQQRINRFQQNKYGTTDLY